METVKLVYKEKERELSVAFAKIDALTRQLDELKKGNIVNSYSINGGGNGGGVGYNKTPNNTELEKLRQELLVSGVRGDDGPLS